MKRLLSLLLAVVLLVITLSSCSGQHFTFGEDDGVGDSNSENATDDVYVTRIEWAEMLGMYFGMDTPTEESTYFTDVKENNSRFPYVQACAEWGVFDVSSTTFDPDSPASTEFAVASVIAAAELNVVGVSDKVEFAQENGLVIKGNTFIDETDANNIILWAREQYKNKPFVEYNNNVFKENVISLTNNAANTAEYSDGTIIINSENTGLSIGDVVIVYEDAQKGIEVARKVTEVINSDRKTILQTETPEFEEVFESLDFAAVATPNIEDIVPSQPGVEIVELNKITPTSLKKDKVSFATLGCSSDFNATGVSKINVPDFGVEVNLTNGDIVVNQKYFDWLDIEITQGMLVDKKKNEKILYEEGTTITDAWGNILYNNTQKYTAGYEIKGSLTVSDLYVESTCKTKNFLGVPYAIERLENEVHFKVESSLSVKGYIKGEHELFRTYVPIPGGVGLGVEVIFSLCVEANGELSVKAAVENSTTVTITGKKVKKINDTDASLDIAVQIDIWSGVNVKATLLWSWTSLKLVDVSAKAGCGMEAGATLHTSEDRCMICIDASAYFPTLSISLGMDTKTLVNKLGIKMNFSIIGKSGALIKSFVTPICHYEISEDGKSFVDKCTWEDLLNEDGTTSDEIESGETQHDHSSVMGISSYSLFVSVGEEKELSVVQFPYGYEATDIRFVSQGGDIAQVKSYGETAACEVIGKSAGTTTIVVETADGKHRFFCAVTVTE